MAKRAPRRSSRFDAGMADKEEKKAAPAAAAPAAAPSGIGSRLLPYAIVWLVMMYGRDLIAGGPPAGGSAPPAEGGAASADIPAAMAHDASRRGLASVDRDAADEEFAEFAAPPKARPKASGSRAAKKSGGEASKVSPSAGGDVETVSPGDRSAAGSAEVLVKLCTS